MGAALTYARRYALFTLVGIAGEDDLDAPDLCDGLPSPLPSAVDRSFKPTDDQSRTLPRKPGNGQRRHGMHGKLPAPLEPEPSAALREKLLTELGTIASADLAAAWAREALSAKNSLKSELAPAATAEAADDAAPSTDVDLVGAHAMLAKGSGDVDQPDGIDKRVLITARPRRYRNREHLRYVAQQACLI